MSVRRRIDGGHTHHRPRVHSLQARRHHDSTRTHRHTTVDSARQDARTTHFSVLPRFRQLLKVLLRMGANLHHRAGFDEPRNLLPALAVLFESLEEEAVFFGRPASRVFGACGGVDVFVACNLVAVVVDGVVGVTRGSDGNVRLGLLLCL